MKTKRGISFTALTAVLLAASAQGASYSIDTEHSSVGFTIKHLVISKVKGQFKTFNGEFTLDDKKGTLAKAEGNVDAASIDTGVAERDKHLKSADFFDVVKFPKLSFRLKKFEGDKSGGQATGDLTIHGVTKPVTLKVEIGGGVTDPWGNKKFAFSASGKINRKDFGLTWNKAIEAGGVMVGEEVELQIEVEGTAK